MLSTSHSPRAVYKSTERDFRTLSSTDLLTVAEAAALLNLPVSWVYERTRRKGTERIPHFRLGKYLRFSQQELLDWLQTLREI